MSTSTPRRAAIYVRISRDKTGAGLGVERQETDCRALAERLGCSVVTVYVDNDLSAYSGKPRPAYQRLLAGVVAGQFDTVLCWHTDRLHRSPTELEEWINACQPRGVEVHTVKAGPVDLATSSGRAVARTLGVWARYESEHRGERVAAAMDRIAKDGGHLGGQRPFGFTSDGMAQVPAEAELIATGTRQLLAGGSLRSVVKMFRDSGVASARGGPWDPTTIRQILSRARNAALVEHRGQIVGSARWPAIVNENEWRGVVTILANPQRRTSPGNQPRWLGSMIYRCSVCLGPMIVSMSGHGRRQYRCRLSRDAPDERRHVSRTAEPLDEFISGLIVARLSQPDAIEVFTPDERPGIDVAAIRAELAGIDQQRIEMAVRRARGEMTLAMMDAANAEFRSRQDALEAELATSAESSPVVALIQSEDVATSWKGLPLDVKRTVLSELLTVTVHPTLQGRRVDGSYFDTDSIETVWKNQLE